MRCDMTFKLSALSLAMADVLVSFKKITGEVHQVKVDRQDAAFQRTPTPER